MSALPRPVLAGLMSAVILASLSAAPAPSYRPAGHFHLSGPGGCAALAIDSAARRLYAGQGDRVAVLDADSGKELSAVAPTPGVSALLLVASLHRGYAADRGDDSVAEFDTSTGAVTRTIKAGGRGPSALAYDAGAGRIFVADQDSGDLAAIDPASGQLAGTVHLGGKLRGIAGNGYGTLWVSAEDRNLLYVVDTHSLALLGKDPLAPGKGPGGIAIDPAGRRIFVPCANGLMPIVDGDAGFVFQVLPIGAGPGEALFDKSRQPNPDGGPPWKARILALSGGGTLAAVQMNAFIRYSFHDKTAIPPGGRALAFDAKTGRAFVGLPGEILILGH